MQQLAGSRGRSRRCCAACRGLARWGGSRGSASAGWQVGRQQGSASTVWHGYGCIEEEAPRRCCAAYGAASEQHVGTVSGGVKSLGAAAGGSRRATQRREMHGCRRTFEECTVASSSQHTCCHRGWNRVEPVLLVYGRSVPLPSGASGVWAGVAACMQGGGGGGGFASANTMQA